MTGRGIAAYAVALADVARVTVARTCGRDAARRLAGRPDPAGGRTLDRDVHRGVRQPSALTVDAALHEVALLRDEATVIPALELERLRNRQVVFFLDGVAQYVDAQPELRDLPLRERYPGDRR